MIKQLPPNAAGVSAEARKVHSFATGMGSQRQRYIHSNISLLRYLLHILIQQAFERRQICGRVCLFCGLA